MSKDCEVCQSYVEKIQALEEALEITIKHEHTDDGIKQVMTAKRGVLGLFGASLMALYRDHKGANYIAYDLTDGDTGEDYELVMQRKAGKTPSELRDEAVADLEALRKAYSDDLEMVNQDRAKLKAALEKHVYSKVCYDVNGFKLPHCCVECGEEQGDPHDEECTIGKLLA